MHNILGTPTSYPEQAPVRELQQWQTLDNKAVVQRLRGVLEDPAAGDTMSTAAYFASRVLVERRLGKRTGQRLAQSEDWAAPQRVTYGDSQHGAHGEYYSTGRHLVVSAQGIEDRADQLTMQAKALGTRLSETDAKVFALLYVGGHESAHAILDGMGTALRVAASDFDTRPSLAASRALISSRPDKGFTGNHSADAAIYEEQFANGYGEQAAMAGMLAAGYSQRQAKNILQVWTSREARHRSEAHREPGRSQVDHLHKVTPDESAAAHIAPGKDFARNEGALGYGLPLTKQELAADIASLSSMAESPADIQFAPASQQEYFELSQRNRGRSIRKYLGRLTLARQHALFPEKKIAAEKKRERLWTLIGGAAVTAAAGIGLGLASHAHETPTPPPEQAVTIDDFDIPSLQVVPGPEATSTKADPTSTELPTRLKTAPLPKRRS